MALLVYSVVRRHMKRTSPGAFTRFDGSQELPAPLQVTSGETLVGWYRNPSPWEDYFVVFTSEALYIVDGKQIERIALVDIVDYELPKSKADVTGVRVLTKDGFRFIRVAGCFGPSGNQKDAFSFIMVVQAIADSNGLRPTILYPPKEVDDVIRQAIAERRILKVTLDKAVRTVEPYQYGLKERLVQLLAYEVAGQTLAVGQQQWRWLHVADISHVELLESTFSGRRVISQGAGNNAWSVLYVRVQAAS